MSSGPNIPEVQRGTVQVKLRLDPAVAAKLDRLCELSESERSAYVARMVERAARRAGLDRVAP